MFVRGISILTGSAVDVGNIPVPRPWDGAKDACTQAAQRALQAPSRFMSVSQRLKAPEEYLALQQERRRHLEALLWIEPSPFFLEKMQDLIGEICQEPSWSFSGAAFDDPAHPAIDYQAAETGVLFAWILRRHGQRLSEMNPRIPVLLISEIRRRLLKPMLAHEDYAFMRGGGRCPVLVAADLLLTCLMVEKSPAQRQQPVKVLLKLLDKLCSAPQSGRAPYRERLTDACAAADVARLLKRLTRGELDLTRAQPPEGWLDGALIPWICGEYFFDPAGSGLCPEVSGMDLYRLGHLSQDRSLCALGAQLRRRRDRPAASVSGRILSMEYMRAAQDEMGAPPRLRRAASEDGSVMLSRAGGLCAAIAGAGGRGNAGDVALFDGNEIVLGDVDGEARSLPLIDGRAPLARPARAPAADGDFGAERDLMSVDLTDCYPEACGLAAYQRTLMTNRADGAVRLVDAFEFSAPARMLNFRFVSPQKPQPAEDSLLLGKVRFFWDGEMEMEISEISEQLHLIVFTLKNPPPRLICGFSFEAE